MYQNSGNILFISKEEHELNLFRSKWVRSYNIFTAASIPEGFKLLQDYDIHLILVKQNMTGMTGHQFCESISHNYPDVIKIIINEDEDTASLERAMQSNLIYRYVQAPYDHEDLKMTIDGALKLIESEHKNRELSAELDKFREQQKKILDLFNRYVPAEVISQALLSHDDQLTQPGESRIVSVLFADIRNFTKLSSRLKASEVVDFLNDYWEEISSCVKQNQGSVNKFMGDGMLAIFGAPVSHIHNHENAVNAALDMVDRLDVINEKYGERLGAGIKIGVGINSGEVVVGNIGTDSYMEYTVIGDTVNMASSMESLSKQKPNSIIISDKTYELVKDSFNLSDPMETRVKGHETPVTFFEVLARKQENIYNIRPGSANR